MIKTDLVPTLFSTADLNGDGFPDLIYDSNHLIGFDDDPSMLHPLLTDGKGGYAPGTTYALPAGFSSACQSGDVNGDSKVDLVCSGYGYRAAVVVVPGQGDGTFGAAIVVPVPPLTGQSCTDNHVSSVGDLNHDGYLDLVVTCEFGRLIVPMLGDGTGHFSAGTPLYASATRIQLADLNGDGKLDMLAQGLQLATTQIFLGHGDGQFDYGQSWPMYNQTAQANRDSLLGDVDGDGHLDLIGGGLGVVRLYRGHADGTFDTTATQVLDFQQGINFEQLGFGVYLYPLAFRDVTGDGIADLVALGTDGLVVFPGEAGMQFGTPKAYPEEETVTFGNFGGQVLLDLNGDGLADFLALGPDGLYLSSGQRDGSFVSGKAYVSGRHVASVAIADFNEDGAMDVVTAGDLQMYLNAGKGDGTFSGAQAIPALSPAISGSQTRGWMSVAAADMNGDGHKDLLAIGAMRDGTPQLFLLPGHGDGSFGGSVPVQRVDSFSTVTAMDVNGDGFQDVVLTDPGRLSFLLQQKDGSYQSKRVTFVTPEAEYAITQPTLGDLNGDGIPDLAYVTTAHAAVAAGVGDGSFAAPVFYTLPLGSGEASSSQGTVAVGDVDGDGVPDMAVTLPFTGPGNNDRGTQSFVLYGTGRKGALDGDSFTAAVSGPTLKQHYGAVSIADVDGDGRGDVIADPGPGSGSGYPLIAVVMRGRADRTVGSAVNLVDGYGAAPLSFADLNGDGRADLVKAETYGNAFAVLLSLQPLQPAGTLTATPNPALPGEAFTITASVTANGQSGPFLGQVTFAADGKRLGSAALVNGSALIAGPAGLLPGDHPLTATTSLLKDEQGSYAPISMSGIEHVALLPVTVSLTSSVNPVIVGQGTNLAVEVRSGSGAPTGAPLPTGQVTMQADGAVLGTGGSDGASALTFSFPYTSSTVGNHVITAFYPGDATHMAGTATLQQVVTPVPGSFAVTVLPNAVTVTPGQAASVQITVTSVDGFFGPVNLRYSGLPSNVTGGLDSPTLTLTPGGHATSTLLFTETTTAKVNPPRSRGGSVSVVAFAAMWLLIVSPRSRRSLRAAITLTAVTCSIVGLSGCSDSRVPEKGGPRTTYTVTVTGTGTQALSASATVALTTAR